MTERNFIIRRGKFWQEFSQTLGSRRLMRRRARRFPQDFRELSQDLNTARAHSFDPALVDRLNRLVLEGHQRLYASHEFSFKSFLNFAVYTFPRQVRANWKGLAAASLVFYGLALFFAVLCLRFPETAYQILPGDTAESLEQMYNPHSSHFLKPRNVAGDADMFGFYIYNNVSIAFRTFAGGILAGLGSLFFLAYNAVLLGAAAGHIINLGFGGTFFSFIIGHSSFELTAIIFSAQAGLLLGYRFFVVQGQSRGAAMRKAGREALPIVAGAALLLVIAAVIEAFWSSRSLIPPEFRYAAGGLGWVLLILYFALAGRRGPAGGEGNRPLSPYA
ncbi:MAG: stage II sporulation protein M [Treponema sp.]|jgi:uncharacterized membrane protein SpoIIM required for sporulation|nr:stage II sporulation protein M [Treponema sp.]